MLSIRTLQPEEFDKPQIAALNLNPQLSVVVVAEDTETKKLKGYWVAQTAIHVEPIWLHEDARDGGFTALKMFAALLANLNAFDVKQFYSFADREEIANYLQRLGLQLRPFIVYEGRVPEIPIKKED